MKSVRELMEHSFDSWETDKQELTLMVDAYLEFQPEDEDFAADMQSSIEEIRVKPPMAAYLPVRIQNWFNQTDHGEWYYDARASRPAGMTQSKRLYRFFFERQADAAIFKLTWGNET